MKVGGEIVLTVGLRGDGQGISVDALPFLNACGACICSSIHTCPTQSTLMVLHAERGLGLGSDFDYLFARHFFLREPVRNRLGCGV